MIQLFIKKLTINISSEETAPSVSINTEEKLPPIQEKFLSFFKERKLQEPIRDQYKEWKLEIFSWFITFLNKKDKSLPKPSYTLENLEVFWFYFSQTFQNTKYRKKPINSTHELRKALQKEEAFYEIIKSIELNPFLKEKEKTQKLQPYVDNGMLVNKLNTYHPTMKSAPFFILLTLFLQLVPGMTGKTSIRNPEDLKIVLQFFIQELSPETKNFDLEQDFQAFISTFIDKFSETLEETGIIHLYKQQIPSIQKEIEEIKQRKQVAIAEAKEKERQRQQQLQQQLNEEQNFLKKHENIKKEVFLEFSTQLLKIKSQELQESEVFARKNISQERSLSFIQKIKGKFLEEKTNQDKQILQSLISLQNQFYSLYVEPFLLQSITEPSSRDAIYSQRAFDLCHLKRQEIKERKTLQEALVFQKKQAFISEIFKRKRSYEVKSHLPANILERLNRTALEQLESLKFLQILQHKKLSQASITLQAETKKLQSLEQDHRKAIEELALHPYIGKTHTPYGGFSWKRLY